MARPAVPYLIAPAAIAALIVALAFAFLGASTASAGGATLTVQKTTIPSGDPQVFTVNLTGPVSPSGTVTDASDFVFSGLPAGTYTLTEVVPAGWQFTSFGCSDGGNSMTFALNNGDDVTCTFTNTKLSTIIVQKTTNPPGSPQTFPITLSGPTPGSGTISDSTDETFIDRMPGSYTITETIPPGWVFMSVNCFGDETSSDMGSVDITVAAGDTVTCVFFDETSAEFAVTKDFQPDNPNTVMVTVSCTTGTSSPPDNVDESGPVSFIITGFSGDPTCTATESGVPPGYTTSSCVALLSAGGCTIVNVQITPTPTPSPGPGTPSPTPSPTPTPTPGPGTGTPTPSPTAVPVTQSPVPTPTGTGAVGGFVDVAATGSGGSASMLVLMIGILFVVLGAALAVGGFRKASRR